MSDWTPAQIEAAALDAMQDGTVVLDRHGDVWQKRGGMWCSYESAPMSSARMMKWRPLTALTATEQEQPECDVMGCATYAACPHRPAPEADERDRQHLTGILANLLPISTPADAFHAANMALAAGFRRSHPAPRTVSAAELDVLPVGSVVLDSEGDAWQSLHTAEGILWCVTTDTIEASSTAMPSVAVEPYTVLHLAEHIDTLTTEIDAAQDRIARALLYLNRRRPDPDHLRAILTGTDG